MSKLSLSEIEELLTTSTATHKYLKTWGPDQGKEIVEDYELDDEGWSFWKYEASGLVTIPGLGTVTSEADYGGEGQGDEYWVVVKLIETDGNVRYFRKDGYYASYSGGEFDGDMYEVKPTEKTITIYEGV